MANVRNRSPDIADRLWSRVNKTESCWLWVGQVMANGYGRLTFRGQVRLVHRVSYELANGPIPEGLHIDHLCRVRNCVNPAHLEAVTPFENTLRGDHPIARARRRPTCSQGHPWTVENTGYNHRGWRRCKACARERERARKERRRAEQGR